MASMFFSTLAEIHAELGDIRTKSCACARFDQAIATERDPWARLH
jgi:hypothetical protein